MSVSIILRDLPATQVIINHPELKEWINQQSIPSTLLLQMTREVLNLWRRRIRDGEVREVVLDKIINDVKARIENTLNFHLKEVINGTGIILHTNLGRAVLPDEAIDHMIKVAGGYCNLEYNIELGARGSRHDIVEDILKTLTGAEAAMVVNNNAAAVFLILREIAKGREVIVSRGEIIEIGGSFRVSEIMSESGAILREVGTTNKTHKIDYENAIGAHTAMLMKVHTSNFCVSGFTQAISVEELARLGKQYDIPVYEDLGSGVLYDLRKHGIGREPIIQESIKDGADIVSFSGDKLLGGPQAGIIVGKKKWIDRMKKNQLARMLRVDKVTLAALEATLHLYLDPTKAKQSIPALRSILQPIEELQARAERFRAFLPEYDIELCQMETEVGGGSLPDVTLPTVVAVLRHSNLPAHIVEKKLRIGSPSIIGRISRDQFLLDFRTIEEKDVYRVAQNIKLRVPENTPFLKEAAVE
ncbi:L-seryl-tRNA(Sec) selenium transferase [Ammoniphilus sp. 3BR4]|uniref:L-seryl-tRNA(Sec) selenium transferase n=1 Tax=Ammoniphilus sp. 3BR4 TaxID=3158265 RepID=UPI003467B539